MKPSFHQQSLRRRHNLVDISGFLRKAAAMLSASSKLKLARRNPRNPQPPLCRFHTGPHPREPHATAVLETPEPSICRNLFGTPHEPPPPSRQLPPSSRQPPQPGPKTPISRNLFGTELISKPSTPVSEPYAITETPSSSKTKSKKKKKNPTMANRIINSYKPTLPENFGSITSEVFGTIRYKPEDINSIIKNFGDLSLSTTRFPTLKEVFPKTYTDYLEVTHVPRERLIEIINDKLGAIHLSYNRKELEDCKFVLPRRADKDNVYIPEIDRIVLRDDKKHQVQRKLRNSAQQLIFLRTFEVLHRVAILLKTNSFLTKRGLFYQAPDLFGKQRVSDDLIEDVSCMLKCTRESLHITAAKTGEVIGDLWFNKADDNEVHCNGGIQIPQDAEHIQNIRTQKAKFILLVEKDSIVTILKGVKFCDNVHCIIITGEGQPSVNTRLFLKTIQSALNLPVVSLFDCNIRGLEMLSIYRWGSKNRSYESARLAIHDILWMGLRPSQLEAYKIPSGCIKTLQDKDHKKAVQMKLELQWQGDTEWLKELQMMMHKKKTAELESLNFDSPTGVVQYLIDRLKEMDFIGKPLISKYKKH